MSLFVDTGLVLAGDVYLAEITNGVRGPLIGPINLTGISITPPTTEEKNRLSNKKIDFGQNLGTVNIPKDPAKLKISWDTMTKSLLADALAGTGEEFSVAESTVTDEAITLTGAGYVTLANDGISNVVVKLASDNSVLVADTDYQVNLDMGMIIALTETAAAAVTVSYTVDAKTGYVVSGATEVLKPRYILIDGENKDTQKRVKMEVWQVQLSATGTAELMSGDYMEGELEGSMVTPAGKTAPYTYKEFN
ncbi:hypothetical protein [Pseudaeromonas paramecii]|uniref:Major tail protein n=1 Tax=Pseudaeromonas paramecii TaxID=2138166 RepID=A0ABP8PVP1_9GAMM